MAMEARGSSSDIDEVPDAILGWTKKQKLDFQDVWASLKGTTDEETREACVDRGIWLYENIPAMKEVFPKFARMTSSDLREDEDFARNAEMVMAAGDDVINNLLSPNDFERSIRQLVNTEVVMKSPITLMCFENFRDKIHLCIGEATCCEKESANCALWYQFLDGFVKVYKKEMERIQQESRKSAEQVKQKKEGCCTII